jgi:hypothetical protein
MHVDVAHWPVVVATYDGQQTDEDVEHYIRRMDEVHARGEPFVALTIVHEYAANFAHVKRLGAWTKETQKNFAHLCKGAATVLPSAPARFLISSFFLIFVPPFPMVAFDEVPPAVAWVRQRLAEAGLPVPPTLATVESSARVAPETR